MSNTLVFGPYVWSVNTPVGQPHNFLIGPDDRLSTPSVVHTTARQHPCALYAMR
jgi:hypothetical protein